MLNFLKLGNIRIPREVSTLANACFDAGARGQISRYEISQYPLDTSATMDQSERQFKEFAVPLLDEKLFSMVDVLAHKEAALLFFRSVSEHNDDWEDYWIRGKGNHHPYFLHVLLKGGGTLRVGTKKEVVQRGDVFLLNPNVNHAYTHTIGEVCTSYCLVVAKPRKREQTERLAA
jgi:hypothetical protein